MTGLGAIPSTAIPAEVRKEGGDAAYKAALGFEGMLLDKLSESLVRDGGLEESPYGSQISESFASSLLQGGGLGLAGQLYASMKNADSVLQSSQAPRAGRRQP